MIPGNMDLFSYLEDQSFRRDRGLPFEVNVDEEIRDEIEDLQNSANRGYLFRLVLEEYGCDAKKIDALGNEKEAASLGEELRDEFRDTEERAERAEALIEWHRCVLRRLLTPKEIESIDGEDVADEIGDNIERRLLEGDACRKALESIFDGIDRDGAVLDILNDEGTSFELGTRIAEGIRKAFVPRPANDVDDGKGAEIDRLRAEVAQREASNVSLSEELKDAEARIAASRTAGYADSTAEISTLRAYVKALENQVGRLTIGMFRVAETKIKAERIEAAKRIANEGAEK